ncbi:MAG: ATP-binding cassette domain-containing protein [Candidatus Latescibacteria bacterium]|nr:ATP-binding cassette domain-containing protein [Candidatus Latescibacterota bacterium]
MVSAPPAARAPGAWDFVRQIAGYAWAYRTRTLLCGLTVVVRAAFMLILPLFYREIFDGVLGQGDSRLLVELLGYMALAFALAVAADLAQAYLASRLAGRIMSDLRRRMHRHLLRLSEGFYTRTQVGEIMSRFTNDLFSVDWAVGFSLLQTLFAGLMVVASTLLLFYLDWRLALPTLALLPLTFAGPRIFSQRVLRANSQRKQDEAELARVLQEDVAGHRVIQAYGLQALFQQRFDERLGRLGRSGIRANLDAAFLTKTSDVGVIVVQLLIVSGGAALALRGDISGGELVAFLTVLFSVGSSIKALTQLVPDLLDGAVGLQRVNALLAEEAQGDEPAGEVLPGFASEIRFEEVGFSYNGSERQLEGVSLAIARGQAVAFVGRSGSGKSTLLNLLTRFYDADQGCIAIDGRDLVSVPRQALRAQMGTVFQHAQLFDTTIRENIRHGRLDATDEQVEAAARAAEIDEFIRGLPRGYDTVVGEGGGRLSGGQRQRIALARAILRDPPILVLDEATSALDARTEAAVNRTLERLAADRTLISVTHRLNAAAGMDCIYVLDQGRLVERGRHKELLNLKGLYYDMWQEYSLELTGNALLGEQPERVAAPAAAATVAEGDDLAELERRLEMGPDELSRLIEKLEAEEAGAQQEAQDLREINQRWAQLVGTDRVSGLPNKLAFLEALVPAEIQQARKSGDPVGFLLMSADNLGAITETHGRNAGDQVVRGLASFLQSVNRGEEILAHLDGANFALLLYPASADQVHRRAQTLREQVAGHALPCADTAVHLTISAAVFSIDSAAITDPKAATVAAFERPASAGQAVDLTGTRILVVDDIPANLDVLFQTLEVLACEVLVARDGESALQLAARARPELILLDVMMPGIDGYETCRRLKADPALREIPVLFLTAREDVEGVVEGFAAGGLDYILKPFRSEEVVARLRTHLERARFARQLAEINAHLEELVEARTRQLQLKVRELQGRDRIARHMLAVHPLEESLQVVLEVVVEVVGVDRAVAYLLQEGRLVPAAALGPDNGGEDRFAAALLSRVSLATSAERMEGEKGADSLAAVPVRQEQELLGVLCVSRSGPAGPLGEEELHMLESLALEAAVVIHDARIRRDPATWKGHLDEILDLDEQVEGSDVLRRLGE